jgi:hypothetical protein
VRPSSGRSRCRPGGHARSCADLGASRNGCPRAGLCLADGEQNSTIAHGKRGPAKGSCCHRPPRLGCASSATEVQSSREESQSRLYADKRAHLPTLDATPRPLKRQMSRETRLRGGRSACCPASALETPHHLKPVSPAGQPPVPGARPRPAVQSCEPRSWAQCPGCYRCRVGAWAGLTSGLARPSDRTTHATPQTCQRQARPGPGTCQGSRDVAQGDTRTSRIH